MPASLRDWLPEDHLAWFVLEAVELLDLSTFHAAYRDDGWGRRAYDPAMMVTLLLHAYFEELHVKPTNRLAAVGGLAARGGRRPQCERCFSALTRI